MNEYAIRKCIISRILRKTDELVFNEFGPNKAFGYSTEWSKTPRSGARWTDQENVDFLKRVKAETVLEPFALSLIAWHHGRSGNACFEQLQKLKYWRHKITLGAELRV